MKFNALALDLDGTLLNKAGELTEEVIQSVSRIAKQNIAVCLVSGRMQPAIEPIWNKLNLNTPIVSYNGSRIHIPNTPEPIYEKRVQHDTAEQVMKYCRTNNLPCNAYFGDRLYTLEDNEYARLYSEYFKVPLYIMPKDGSRPYGDPFKILAILPEEKVEQTYQEFCKHFKNDAEVTTSSRKYVEILPKGVNKATAVLELAKYLNIPIEQWIAVGDGMNDLEMLMCVGFGLAVEDAEPKLLEQIKSRISPLSEGGMDEIAKKYFTC